MSVLREIMTLAAIYAKEHRILLDTIQAYKDDVEEIKIKWRNELQERVRNEQVARVALASVIEANPEGFVKPRTMSYEGIKFGLTKVKKQLKIPDPDYTIKKIRDLFPDLTPTLIETKDSLVRAALNQLDDSDLLSIGVEISDQKDEVVIKTSDKEIEKLLKLLESAIEGGTS